MAIPIECSYEDLVKSLNALRSRPENEAFQRLRVELLLSAVHFQVMKRHMLEPSSQDVQSRSGSSYMGICTSSARGRAHGHPECCFWYGIEDIGIDFLAVMRPTNVLGSSPVGSEMIALTDKVGIHVEQRRRKQNHTAYALATDGGRFRFFRIRKEGQSFETQCGSGNDYEDIIMLLSSVYDDALAPPGPRAVPPHGHADLIDTDQFPGREDYYKDLKRMRAMAIRAGVTVYMDVIQNLPNLLSPDAEKNTLNLLVVVINKATEGLLNAIGQGDYEHRIPDYGRSMTAIFDTQLKKLLEEADFEDYNDNQKVLKRAIRKAALQEIRPVFEEIFKEARKKKLAKMFK
ncbi:uncharacterized protein N7500_002374 [Penicillium coprophilum]|uniref:uncharacterized protein n=1 Tax=Penicillium coprophilum TaxID=36646 RepID=UPI0023A6D8FF|nr:uncharacterized protein N7500_002374 [Penicillium coprophilum]KAJ5169591.1 hypothetical protein N7500_002374 [Penicillium coprophilum]